MVAKVELAGNQQEGYTVTVTLPAAWLERWQVCQHIAVADEDLCDTWGYQNIAGEFRYRTEDHYSISAATAAVEQHRNSIKTAKTFLRLHAQEKEAIIGPL
jgi:hypothetical protein